MADLTLLILQAKEGNVAAYSAIVRRFQDMAVGYAYGILGNHDSAKDAAQEAFLEAYTCLGELREPRAFSAWFRRILFKQCDRITRRRSLTQVPCRPYFLNSNMGATTGKDFCPEVMVVIRCPWRIESGRSWSKYSCSRGL